MTSQTHSASESDPEMNLDDELQESNTEEETCEAMRKLLDSSDGRTSLRELHKFRAIGERLYKNSCLLDEKIHCFESNIRRSYFHMKPLDTAQLENWHKYLDFVEGQKDFDWVIKLYERCLIPAANYSEFWMRYVAYVERKGGREIANFALDRATEIFLKDMPTIHLYSARFKEASGDIKGARAALFQFKTKSDENFIENAIVEACMEKRLGNHEAASNIYREAIDRAISKNELNFLPTLYVHYCQHIYVTTNSAVAARDILIEGIRHIPSSKLLYEELITFATTHGGNEHMDVVGSVVAAALSTIPGELQVLSSTDQEYISKLYLKFVDLCGTTSDIRNAWNRHMKIFSHFLRAAYVNPPTGAKPWKSLLGKKQRTFADSPQSNGVQPKEASVPENAVSSPKSLSVDNDSPERDQKASNRLSGQSMENDAGAAQAPEDSLGVDNVRSNQDHVVNQHHLPSVSHRPKEISNPEELSASSRVVPHWNDAENRHSPLQSQPSFRAESQHQSQDNIPFESRPRWHRMNHRDRPRRDSRFWPPGYFRRRMHHHQQLNPPQPQYPSFPPPNQQIQPGNDNTGNQFQAWPPLNYNMAPGYMGQVPPENVTFPEVQFPNYLSNEQSCGDLQSSQAYFNQMWQYYYYYQQQQLFIQQQVQQMQITQSQLQQQSPEYQQVVQQLIQLQQQQQNLYQLQQQLYQLMQMMQQQAGYSDQLPVQQDQGLEQQQHQRVEEEEIEEEQKVKEAHQPEHIP